MALTWTALRRLVLKGPDPRTDPYRMAFEHLPPDGAYSTKYIPWQRSRGGDAIALAVPSPWQNPIGAGIVWTEGLDIFGPPPAQYEFGTVFFNFPSPGQLIGTAGPPIGGPLYSPATLAALLGQPGTAPDTTTAISQALVAQQRMGESSF